MANKDQYSGDDFVKVVDAAGRVQADAVPRKWIGTDLLPEGTKQATKKQLSGEVDDSSSSSSGPGSGSGSDSSSSGS